MHTEGTLIALVKQNLSLDTRTIPRDKLTKSSVDQLEIIWDLAGCVHTCVCILPSIVLSLYLALVFYFEYLLY